MIIRLYEIIIVILMTFTIGVNNFRTLLDFMIMFGLFYFNFSLLLSLSFCLLHTHSLTHSYFSDKILEFFLSNITSRISGRLFKDVLAVFFWLKNQSKSKFIKLLRGLEFGTLRAQNLFIMHILNFWTFNALSYLEHWIITVAVDYQTR